MVACEDQPPRSGLVQRDVAERLSWHSQARRRNKLEVHPLMAKPLIQQGPCRLGLQSIPLEIEFISNPLNPVAYSGEIWSNSLLSTVHLLRTIAQWTLRLDVGSRCSAEVGSAP